MSALGGEDLDKFKDITIIPGSPASGKTTLAKRLAGVCGPGRPALVYRSDSPEAHPKLLTALNHWRL